MAIATAVVNGETITFDTEVRDSILAELTPGGGANLADWSIVISGMLLAVATRNVVKPASWEIYTNGKALAIDAGTNWLESASTSSLNSAARSFITALGGAASGFFAGGLTGIVLSPTSVAGAAAGVAVGFGVGNATSNLIGDGWDYIIGPDIKFLQNLEGTKERILSTGSLKNVLLHHWTNSNPAMSIKDIVNKIGQYELKLTGSTPLEMVYVKDDDKYTFSSGGTQENFETLLKYLDAGDTPFFKVHNNEEFQLERNYLNDFGHNYPDFSDQLGRYALLALRPYITTLDKDFYTAVPSADNFSAKFIADRKALYEDAFIFEEKFGGQLDEFTSQYIDLKYGIETDWGVFKNVIGFGGGGGSVLEGTMLDDRLYGVAYNGDGLSAYDDVIKGGMGDDYIEGGKGNDRLYGGDGDDIIYAYADAIDPSAPLTYQSSYSDYIEGGDDNDTIYGSKNNDVLYGDDVDGNESGKDVIHGYGGSDTIYGGADDDTLIGGLEGGVDDGASDYLEGGEGKDTYLVNNGDTIMDSDGEGLVKFDNIDLTGKKYKNSKTGRYEDDDYIYDGDPDGKGPLTVTSLKDSSKSITIQAWENKALGIELLDNKDIEVSITESASASEGDSGKRSLSFTLTLSRALEDGESLDVSVSNTDEGSYTFESGEQSKTFTHSWQGDTRDEGAIDHIATLTPSASYTGPSDDVKVTIKNSGTATVYDDDEDQRYDPLALDTNKDGFISTSDLETSGTYFDITGDGLRERVGWIKSEDALVTYDKNDNGQIDGIDEVFGNMSESGFEELKRLIDSNHDNIIDRKDELFNRLQVWNDFNQDAKVQTGELRSLKDAGVTSIDLNYVSTNIEINGNLLTEASKYTDAQGNKELAADIQLATDAKDTKLNLEDLPQDFTIDPATQLLPQLKGTGLIYDSLITYNLDPEFKALAQEMSTNMPRVATEFTTFLEHYSGYTAYVNELREKYSIENFQMQEVDKQAWIVERFEATDKYTTTINNYYNKSLKNGKIPTTPITNSDTIAIKYQSLANQLESTFAMQSVYQEVFSDTHYDLETQSFIVDDKNALESKLSEYFNSDTNTIDEKLYLAKVMQMQQGGLEFEIDTILKSINNDITKELARYIFTVENATLFENKESYTTKGVIVTSGKDEIITTSDAGNKILLNGGDDKLISGKGNDTFYFRKGDGADTIFDKGGVDILVFDEAITRESVELKLNRNSDLIIAFKEDGKTFDELSDKVIMVDWMKSSNRVELIKFGDGTTLKFQDVFELFEATDGVEVIQLSSGNDIIDTKDGNDVIVALGGNDTLIGDKGDDRLEGGLGNDTYIYARGDGKDTIIDSGGHDTLQFREGISQNDLLVQYKGNDLLIALKEEGKTFEQLSDVITLKNYKNAENTIEAIYLDGYRRVDIDALLNAPTEFDDIIELSNNDQNIDLLAGNDNVVTLGGNDIVYGGSGNDVIKTNSGNDTLAGGTGDDVLEGGLGNDTYIYNRGDGKDTIYDDYSYGYQNTQKDNAGNDTLRLGEGITADDIITKYYGTDLMIGIKEGDKPFEELSDVITIKNYGDEKNKIEHIVLSDGSEIEVTGPVSINGYETVATTGDDVLFFEEALSIDTLQGHDFIHTGSGNDNVFGNRGNDDIHTGDGDDILNGGVGIDYLLGGDGNDTYIFNRGDGNNTIFDDNRDGYVPDTNMYHGMYTTYPKITQSSTPQKDAGIDTLIFGEGIALDDIEVRISTESFSSSPRDIVIYIKENGSPIGSRDVAGNIAGDTVTIRDYFDSRNKIENILLSDGTRIDIDSMINQVTNGDDQIIYLSSNEDMTVDAQDGNDIVKTGLGNDTLIGGKGDDQLQGGGGDDTYIFNLGDGKDTIYDYDEARGGYFSKDSIRNGGNDTLKFGEGIKQEDLSFVFQGNELEIKIIGTEDSIIIKNYDNSNNAIENIVFDDGTKVDLKEMALKSLGENVVVPVQESQENVYSLNYDEGVKTILNSKANDTLQIAEDIGVEQLIAQFVGNDLVIALKESGISFDGLKDKVIIKNYLLDKIENITLNNGTKIKLNELLLQASEDNDTLHSYEQEVIIVDGLAGNDTIATGSGNDTLIGGKGDDVLNGGAGDDTYIFNRGDGQDIISSSNGNDTLKFAEGIEAQDLEARFVGQDLVIGVKESGINFENWSDKVTIKSNFINNITLNDGTKLFVDDLLSQPTQGDDILDYTYTENSVTVDGLGGNDTITTSSSNDTIIGGNGNDTLNSGAGNDTLNGGSGDDTISSGAGNDTYIFNRGDGKDSIVDSDGNDSITFGEGVAQSDLLFKQDGYSVTIALKEDGKTYDELSDKIVITDWFKLKNNIETLKFVDGSSISASEIATMLLSSEPDTLYSKHGAEIFGGMGDDTYVYKKDDFTVIIDDRFANKEIAVNAGNDTLQFEDITQDKVTIGKKGDDLIIKIDAGHDTYTELKDYVVIRDWQDANKGIESIVFADGEVLVIDKTLPYPELEFDENWITGRYYIYGSENNDIKGTDHSEVIESGAGNDMVMALGGNDYILGGKGNDTLYGGSGNDTYVFNIGDGNDTIIDTSGLDSIKFGANITRADISITQIDNDLVLRLSTDDSLTLKDWFNEETIEHRIELMVLEDEGEIAIADFIITPTEGNDNLEYGDEKNRINALGGDDIIHIGGGDDVLSGGDGNDQLYGEEGNDTLSGDKGDDILYGGEGDDTYVFARGDGKDTIIEDGFTNWGQTGNDTLKFAEGISADDLILRQVGDDLIVALKEDGKSFEELSNTITLKKWALYDDANSRDLSRAYYAVENFTFSDGTSWSTSDIIANIGSDASETIIGFNQADTLEGKKGNDILLGHLGDDTYIFNRGDGQDIIYDYGRKGENYSYYDAGNDTLKFGEGISEDELMIVKEDNDVIVYIKDGNKSLDELHDKIILKDWFLTNNRIENMVLFNGVAIDYIKHLTLEPTMEDDKLIYGSDDNYVDALAGDDIVISLGGNNFIDGNSGNDSIQTADGNDTLLGGEGDDTLDGGAGEDRLEGGSGNDTYIFGRGDGHNTIYDENGIDTLKLDASITQDDLVLFQDGRDLVVAIKEDGVDITNAKDKIIIVNWLDAETRLETITFIDETVWDVATIISKTGTEKNDTISGTELDDELYAGQGNDTLLGGTGDDYLEGGEGNDTYIFNRGDGHDEIYDVSGTDSLRFGEDIATDDLLVRQDGDDLIIALKEDGVSFDELSDRVTIQEYFSFENQIENFDFADGSSVLGNDILQFLENEEGIILYGTSGSDILIGSAGDDTLYGGDDDDTNMGDDTFIGNEGDDMLYGGWGNDTYLFNRGDGHDTIYDAGSYSFYGDTGEEIGHDKIVFGEGISKNNLIVHIDDADNLTIGLVEAGVPFEDLENTITIEKYNQSQYKIEAFVFADGSSIMGEEIFEHINNNIIYGTSGDDTLYGSAGDEIFYAGDGNDTIYGYGGNDTYIGGKGRDYMNNWDGGDDTYIFNRGDGQDIIYDYLGNDTLRFGAGIRAEDLIIRKSEDDVIIGLKESEKSFKFLDKITLSNWHDSSSYRIENIVLNDGTRIDMSSMLLPTKMADRLYADDIGTTIDGLAGNDTIYGNTEDNIIIGGKGADSLFGGGGDDVYLFNRGDGHDNIYDSDGADSLQFGIGISTNDLIFRSDNDDFIIGIKEDGKSFEELSDVVRLHDWFSNNNSNNIARATVYASVGYSKVENILFSDGSSFDTSIFDTKKPDTLYPEDNSNYIYGGYEDNVFAFNRGDGHTNIYDYNGNDTLRFGEGISVDDLVIQSEGTSILIGIKEDGKSFSELSDRVVLSGWFNSDQKIETTLFHDGTVFDTSVFNEFTPDYLRLDNTDNIAYGQGGDDTIYGNGGNDILYGGDGNDYIDGGLGNDIYIGGKGNDHIYEWSQGDDTYIYNRGDGQDSIWDHNGNDTLSFGEGINIDDMVVQLETANGGLTIVVGIKEEGKTFAELSNKIQLNGWLNHESGNKLISFSNGETYTIKELYQHLYGTQVIFGSDVDETITGGAGDDILIGGLGNDTYVFNRGDGNDTIVDISQWGDMNEDILSFGEGITVDDLDVFYYEESLKINILATDGSTNDSITILNWYSQSAIEFIRLSDGSEYSIADYFGVPMNEYPGPIVLDLNHNGITSTTLETSNAYFDYDGDGNREHTGWTDKGDALLVADLNNDGIINDGSEQFGERTRLANGLLAGSGYEALVQYDTNGDRIIDNRDEAFGNLLLWKDANQNGKTEEGELINIQTSGILALHLDQASGITFEQSTENGNIILNETNYVTLGGGGIMRDVGFAYDPFNTITDNDTLIVEQYGSTLSGAQGDDTYLFNLGEGKVTIDDMGDGMDIIRFGVNISKEQLIVKWDKASGDLIIGVKENGTDINSLADLYDQIHIKNFFDESGSIEEFRFADGSSIDKNELYDILLDTKETQNLTAIALEKDGQLIGGAFNDLLYGQDSEEELQGGAGDDFLNGQSGDDLLDGGEGDDVLVGGEGDDSLYGGAGDDYYIYNKGDGKDLITESFGNDSIILGEGILKDDLIIQRDGDDLLVGLKDGDKTLFELSDLIRIKNQFIRSFEVETIELASGEIIHLPTSYELVAEDITVSLLEDTSTTGTLNITNPIGGALTYEIVEMSNNGEFTLDAEGSYSYIPSANYNGTDSVSIKVTNEYGLSTTATLSFEIEAVNDAPILLNNDTESYTLKNIREAEGSIEATDIDGDTLNYTVTTAATHGVLNIDANGNWNYQADASFNGKDSAVITVDDGNGGSAQKILNFSRDGYIYEGEDLIIEDNGSDVLVMDGVSKNDLTFIRSADDLEIYVKEQGDITLKNYFANIDAGVATLQTAQGEINLSKDAIKSKSNSWFKNTIVASDNKDTLLSTTQKNSLLIGQGGNDTMFGGSGNDIMHAKDGNDLLVGGAGNDTLYGENAQDTLYGDTGNDFIYGGYGNDAMIGGEGNDTLYGEEGDDFLSSGTGNDALKGGLGNDTYFFGKGDGNDTIADSEPSKSFLWFKFNTKDGGSDTVKFDKDIAKDDISFYMKNKDLILQYGDNDSIVIKNQNDKNAQIEKIELSDGNYLTNDDIDLVIQQINAYGKDRGIWNIDNKTIQANNDLMNIVSSAWQV